MSKLARAKRKIRRGINALLLKEGTVCGSCKRTKMDATNQHRGDVVVVRGKVKWVCPSCCD